jgi:hypothetical protein
MTILGIRQQTCMVDDPAETTLVAIVAVSLAYAEVWAEARDGTERFIGRSTGTGKVDSASPSYFADGTVRLSVSAAVPGGSGTTSYRQTFDFPNELTGLDAHLKERIYERVANPTTGTHNVVRGIAREEAAAAQGAQG